MNGFEPGGPAGWLSVGDVARLAGVSTRAVRHYHAVGLTPEPARDASGYRRYGGRDVLALVRVVRLRALGVPIPQIAARVTAEGEDASPPSALRALAEEIDGEVRQLAATRDRLLELARTATFEQPEQALSEVLRRPIGASGADPTRLSGRTHRLLARVEGTR